ncbi:MAG: TRL-like family protein [Leptospiraceae bacterium]|nr:TRL-like family protein [Leptospiraceae bacterium]
MNPSKRLSLVFWKTLPAILLLSLVTGCIVVQSQYGPPTGLFFQRTTMNHAFPKGTDLGSRVGTACVQSYAWLYSNGEAGVRAAAAEGGITTIRAVDYSILRYFIFYEETCTIVYGD